MKRTLALILALALATAGAVGTFAEPGSGAEATPGGNPLIEDGGPDTDPEPTGGDPIEIGETAPGGSAEVGGGPGPGSAEAGHPAADNNPAGHSGTQLRLLVEANTPTYTITIPESIDLSPTEPTEVPITVSDVESLGDLRISVRFGGTQRPDHALALQSGPGDAPGHTVLYRLLDPTGKPLVQTHEDSGNGLDTELVAFRDIGTRSYWVEILDAHPPEPGVEYVGTITYNIALVG